MQTILDNLPILKKHKEPTVALVIGFMFGGIGLGLYFRSFIDFVVPIGACIALLFMGYGAQMESLGYVAGAFVAAAYGYIRAQSSNTRLAAVTERGLPEPATLVHS